nr:hypothetical protein CUMW_180770 [Ipomoea batatas]
MGLQPPGSSSCRPPCAAEKMAVATTKEKSVKEAEQEFNAIFWSIINDGLVLIPGAAVLRGDHKLVIHAGDDLSLSLDHAFEFQIGFSLFVVGVYGELCDLHHLGSIRILNGAPAAYDWTFLAATRGGDGVGEEDGDRREREER